MSAGEAEKLLFTPHLKCSTHLFMLLYNYMHLLGQGMQKKMCTITPQALQDKHTLK